MQYAYVVCGIMRKAEVDRGSLRESGAMIRLTHATERQLALALIRFPEELEQAAAEYRPNFLTEYIQDGQRR